MRASCSDDAEGGFTGILSHGGFEWCKLPRMPEQMVERLEEAKRRFGAGEGSRTAELIAAAARERFADAASLARFHETLLFLRAYPASVEVAREADRVLSTFAGRVTGVQGLDEPEISGIAGTAFSAVFSYDVARRLAAAYPGRIDIDWDGYETDRLGRWFRRFLPLLEEDWMVEANPPYLEWLRAAKGDAGPDLPWLLKRLEADQYDSLELPLRWELGESEATRTRARLGTGPTFFHDEPLIRRCSMDEEIPELAVTRLSPKEGKAVIEQAVDTSAPRYRELYGFTYGDPARVVRAEAGRGVTMYLWGVPPARRLPLRAYHCAVMAKNGVLVGYVETLSLFERMEVGFNIYYTFREGESAWLYTRLMRLLRQLTGVTCFSVDPYQIGHHNEEAIASGAFWFYRKLGFRPVGAKAARLLAIEERRIAADRAYRTPPATLRKFAAGYMVYDKEGSWDRFRVRNLGLALQRRMAERFNGDARRMRRAAMTAVGRALGIQPDRAFEPWALLLALIPDLGRWTPDEKRKLVEVLLAKQGPDESRYLRLMARHGRLRYAILSLGGT